MDNYFLEHITDISDRAYNSGVSAFSDFLNMQEQNLIEENRKKLCNYEFFGGAECCERKIARFSADNSNVFLPFPIVILKISPLNIKFADKLSHRDYLGAIMNLGIERSCTGDIIIDEKTAFVFILEEMADYISENLNQVRNTRVVCEKTTFIPEGITNRAENKTVILSSLRIDCIICGVYNLSRSVCSQLFSQDKVFCNSRLINSSSFIPDENDIISVRGTGRFKISEICGNTKKGKIVLNISKFI